MANHIARWDLDKTYLRTEFDSLRDLVAMARAQPGALNWAGVTGALDFLFAGWLKQEGLNINKVPYRNPVDAANDLAEGRVQVYEASLAIVRPQLQAGKIKLLEAIDQSGSISQAGRTLGMSYRRAWLLIDDMNRCFREPVVTAQPGGSRAHACYFDGGGHSRQRIQAHGGERCQ